MKSEQKSCVLRFIRRQWFALLGGMVVLAMLLCGLFSSYIAPHDPYAQSIAHKYASPNEEHLLGTDAYGRDVFSRVLHGARVSLLVGTLSVAIGALFGIPLGVVTGYCGGKVDALVVELINVLMAFPTLLLGIMVLALTGGGLQKVIVVIGISLVARFARLARSLTYKTRERAYCEASRALGESKWRIMVRHILPNISGDLVVMTTLWIPMAIQAEASLSFLGLGIRPPTPSWGGMIREGTQALLYAPWVSIVPGIAIFMAVLAFNIIGDSLRDALDPKSYRAE
jgi:peptide/nickel transport system permease protein